MKKIIVPLLAAAVLYSCRDLDKAVFVDDADTTVIELESKHANRISLDKFVDSIKYVELETTPECLINQIARVFVDDGQIIIPDYRNHEVYVFDENGKYLSKISRRGRGPQEYVNITTAMYDPKANNIIIQCSKQYKLLFYDLEGKFVREISDFSDNMWVRDIINLPNGNFLCYNGIHYPDGDLEKVGLWEVDSNGKFLKWLLKPQRLHPTVSNNIRTNLHYRNGGEIGFWDTFTDDDFHYSNDTLKRIRTYELPVRRGKDLPGVYMSEEKYASRTFLVEKGNYALSEWHDLNDQKTMTVLHSVEDNSVFSGVLLDYGCNGGIIDNALPGQILDNNLDDVFIQALYSTWILRYAQESYYSPEAIKTLGELTQGMSEREIENMNPILGFYYLRKSGK